MAGWARNVVTRGAIGTSLRDSTSIIPLAARRAGWEERGQRMCGCSWLTSPMRMCRGCGNRAAMATNAGSGIWEASSLMMTVAPESSSWKIPPLTVVLRSVMQTIDGRRTRSITLTASSVASELSRSAILCSSRSSSVRWRQESGLNINASNSRRPSM